jgi:hypothetical protein
MEQCIRLPDKGGFSRPLRQALVCGALFCLVSLPARAVTLVEAADTPGLVWTTGGQASWTGESDFTHDGVDALQSGSISDDAESWIQAQVTGPGLLSFWWKVSSEPNLDRLELYVGSTLQASISGEVDWTFHTILIPSGTHMVKWRYSRDLGAGGLLDMAWLDEVSFAGTVEVADSLDTPWVNIVSGGHVGWMGQTNITHDGQDAACNGPIGNSQASWMEASIAGPLTFDFWWKVSSELDFDFHGFYVDGVLRKQISGEVDWTKETVSIPGGWHRLRWQYTKDQNLSSGQDRGWVDALGLPLPFGLSGPAFQPDHSAMLRITGLVAGTSYQLEISSNLNQWTRLAGFTGATYEISITDTTAKNAPIRFYRVVSP